jgi:sterol desaturase/sphingolipid hydroxylase (fatty acid hydroxylase superfamily)
MTRASILHPEILEISNIMLLPLPARLLVYAVAAFSISLEILFLHLSRKRGYAWRESLASLGIGVGHAFSNSLTAVLTIGLFELVWNHRLWTIPLNQIWSFILLFLGLEFCYYWHHRAAHQVRWLWATHAVHHSAEHLNLSAAYRLGWTGWLSGNFLFFLPLCWLGFHPIAVAIGMALNLFYQFWIHTELIPKLGPLEWILNTPSHHRVHHASNSAYIDRNYGGVLILFDRLFGTLVVEQSSDPPVYGLTCPIRSYNPLKIVFGEWQRLFRALYKAKTWGQRWQVAFGPPN